jgi:hypothetical protein
MSTNMRHRIPFFFFLTSAGVFPPKLEKINEPSPPPYRSPSPSATPPAAPASNPFIINPNVASPFLPTVPGPEAVQNHILSLYVLLHLFHSTKSRDHTL